jgi:type IX secretion system PorP/SprF family membrane protein
MKKRIFSIGILVWLLLLGGAHLSAQQLPVFSQYMLNDYFHNPAIAGTRPCFDAVSANRLQWTGITDAPRSYVLSLHGPIKSLNMGVGGYLFSDITGPTRRAGFSGTYAYHIKVQEKINVSLSLSAGMVQFAVDISKLTLDNPTDYVFASSYTSKIVPDLGASFLVYDFSHEDGNGNWWVGGYAPQLFPVKLNLFYNPQPTGRLVPHFYGMGGYKLFITNDFFAEPNFLVKFVSPAPFQIDIGGRVIYKNKAWLGLTYRTKDAMSVIGGYTYKENITFGYSYDITTTNLKTYSNGTHELVVGFRFKTTTSPSPINKEE